LYIFLLKEFYESLVLSLKSLNELNTNSIDHLIETLILGEILENIMMLDIHLVLTVLPKMARFFLADPKSNQLIHTFLFNFKELILLTAICF